MVYPAGQVPVAVAVGRRVGRVAADQRARAEREPGAVRAGDARAVRQASLLRAVFIEIRKFLQRKGVLDEIGPVGARSSADLTGGNGSGTLARDL